MAPLRPQQYRISWPLTPKGVEDIDTMFETLFKALRGASASIASSSSLVPTGGLSGIPGPPGDIGEDGADGAPGSQGIAGSTGPQGPSGLGVPGNDGTDGDDGIPGVAGTAGVTGAVGPQGATGMGVPGADGEDGDTWPQGRNSVPSTGTGLAVLADSPALTTSPTAPTQTATDSSTKLATTAFVSTAIANAVAGVNPAVAVEVASAAILPNSPTYNNGVSGIGASITTATTNTALVVDGYTPILGDRVLVKNEGDTSGLGAAKNGVYTVTQLAAVALAWILTRALDYDTSSDINNTGAIPVENHGTNALTSWLLTTLVTTVGTDSLLYTQFSYAPSTLARLSVQNTFSNTSGQIIQGPLDLTGASAGQIKFPASQNASSDVNTLDDYEEGTWTPVLGGSTSETGQSYYAQTGSYIKIGKLIHLSGYVALTAKGTIVGNIVLKGFPFPVATITRYYPGGAVVIVGPTATAYASVSIQMNTGASNGTITTIAAGGDFTTGAILTANISNTFGLGFFLGYLTDN